MWIYALVHSDPLDLKRSVLKKEGQKRKEVRYTRKEVDTKEKK
jgi:hypothetical protein